VSHPFDPKHADRLESPERLRELPPSTVVDLLRLKGDETVVDYGAGTGVYTIPVAAALPGGRVLAVEARGELAERLEGKLQPPEAPRVQIIRTGANQVPAADGVADRVLLVNVLHHIHDDPAALAEILRLLRPGGLLVDIDWDDVDRPAGPPPEHVLGFERSRDVIAGMGLRELEAEPAGGRLSYELIVVAEKPAG
jgi:ubiquinone/menaquinone biosynthesis C-methylase UbiE